MREPDYANYSLEELTQARQSIDALRFPERVRRLEAAISAQQQASLAKKPTDVQTSSTKDMVANSLLLMIYPFACWAVYQALTTGAINIKHATYIWHEQPLSYCVYLTMYLTIVVAPPYRLWKRKTIKKHIK